MSDVISSLSAADVQTKAVMQVQDADAQQISALLLRFGLLMKMVDPAHTIPGSYWGESEAGLIGNNIYCRPDTPLQSLLHEACHFICMDTERRSVLNRDAGGDFDEENAVCYLQIILSDRISDFGRDRMLTDMDAWGYTFRLGSSRAWFEQEADEAKQWLQREGVLSSESQLTWVCRE